MPDLLYPRDLGATQGSKPQISRQLEQLQIKKPSVILLYKDDPVIPKSHRIIELRNFLPDACRHENCVDFTLR